MKIPLLQLGIVLVILGSILLVYEGFTYTKHEVVAQLGDLQVTADTKKHVYISPIIGGTSLVLGVILIIASRRKGGGDV